LSIGGAEVDDVLWSELSASLAGEASREIHDAQARADRLQQIAAGEADSYVLIQRVHATQPELTEWRLMLEMLAETLPGKKKLILDGRGRGRRHLLLGVGRDTDSTLAPLLEPESVQDH
jgi:regulator of protease activity HflC (stomatin/prohibitin superfamily)